MTTTTRRTIRRNAHRQIAAIREAVTRARVYSLRNDFTGIDVDPAGAFADLEQYDFARLYEEVPGRKWTIEVHGNLWFTLYAGEQTAEESAGDLAHRAVGAVSDLTVSMVRTIRAAETTDGVLHLPVTTRTGTAAALIDRGIIEILQWVGGTAAGKYVHPLTPLGQLVQRALVEGVAAVPADADAPNVPVPAVELATLGAGMLIEAVPTGTSADGTRITRPIRRRLDRAPWGYDAERGSVVISDGTAADVVNVDSIRVLETAPPPPVPADDADQRGAASGWEVLGWVETSEEERARLRAELAEERRAEVAAAVESLPAKALAALRDAVGDGRALVLDLVTYTYGEAYRLEGNGLVFAMGPTRTGPFVLTDAGRRVRTALLSREGERVTDLSTVPVGARLRVDHPSRVSTTLTVTGAFDRYGNPPQTGLLCHRARRDGAGWDTVLTPAQAEDAAVWLLAPPTDPPAVEARPADGTEPAR